MTVAPLRPEENSTPHANELELLRRLSDDVRRNKHGRAAVLHGPRGAGAEVVLTAWKRELLQKRDHVFDTECIPGAAAYTALSDIVVKYTRAIEDLGLMDESLNELFLRVGGSLGVPRLVGLEQLSERPVAPGSHILFYESLGHLFTELSRRVPAVVILRNLHLADSATRAAVSFLVQNVITDPVGSFAPAGLQRGNFCGSFVISVAEESALRSSLERTLSDRSGVVFINLRGATEETVRRFLMQQDVVARFVESSGGLTENLPELIDSIPRKVEDLFLRRSERMSEEERTLLGAMAVFGRPIQPDLLLRVVESSSKGSLSSLLDNRLVTKRVLGGQLLLDLPSEQNREVVYGGLDTNLKSELHGRIAELLEERSRYGEAPDLAELARHYLKSPNREKAVQYCLGAAERLHISFAYEQAQELLEGVLPVLTDSEGRRQVLDRLVDLCACLSEHRRALFYCGLLKREVAPEMRGSLYRRVGEMLLELGSYRKALRSLEKARALVDAEADRPEKLDELIRNDAVTAEALYGRGMYDDVERVCSEALAKITASPVASAQRQVFSLTNTLGKVYLFKEDYVRAAHAFLENQRRADEHNWPNETVRARFNLGAIALRRCEYDKAEKIFSDCLSFGISAQNPLIRAFCLMNLGVVQHKTHAYSDALDSYLNSLATFKKSGNDLQFAVVALNLGDLYLTLGDLDRARALAESSLEITKSHDIKFFEGWANHVMGGIALEAGQLDLASESLAEGEAILESIGSPTWLRRVKVRRAKLALLQNDEELAQGLLEQVPFGLDERDGMEIEGEARMVRAQLLQSTDAAAALDELRRAKSLFEQLEAVELIWMVELSMAELAIAGSLRAEATTHLKRAQEGVEALADAVPAALRDIYNTAPRRVRITELKERLERGVTGELRSVMALPKKSHYQAWRAKYAQIIGENRRLLQIFRMIDRVADSDSTVLVQGESGTGKELIAEAIHGNSARCEKPFIKVNCAAFVETLLLSELFGHEKGAFTGALNRKKGRFELAHGGTIFLDEIGDISPNTQVALLRVLQERTFERVGGSDPINVDVRVVVATNRNIEEMVRRGEFRLDLYYRLKGIVVDLPALRERRADIPKLLQHFVDKNQTGQRQTFSHDALGFLARYSWPGNIRELENFTRSMILFVDDSVVRLQHVLEFEEFFADGDFCDTLPEDFFEDLDKGVELELVNEEPGPKEANSTVIGDSPARSDEVAPSEAFVGDPSDAMMIWAKSEGLGLPDLRKRLEVECIKRALIETDGNITKAAKALDMKRPRLSQIINATPELAELKKALLSA